MHLGPFLCFFCSEKYFQPKRAKYVMRKKNVKQFARFYFTCKNSSDIGDQDSGSTENKNHYFFLINVDLWTILHFLLI